MSRPSEDHQLWLMTINATAGLMLGAGILSGVVALASMGGTNVDGSKVYTLSLSSVVCLVAWYHYDKIFSAATDYVEKGSYGNVAATSAPSITASISTYRFSDWLATLPLLGLELSELAKQEQVNPPLDSPLVTAILLGLGVIGGAVARFTFVQSITSWRIAWACSCVFIALPWGFFLSTGNATIIAFTFPWACYALVDLLDFVAFENDSGPDTEPKKLVDIAYAVLDVWSKACLAIYVASKACNVEIVTGAANFTG